MEKSMYMPCSFWLCMAIADLVTFAFVMMVTSLFLRFCQKKYKKQENCFLYYDLEIGITLSQALPWMLMIAFLLGEVVTMALRDWFAL